jgi:hypothetical protein
MIVLIEFLKSLINAVSVVAILTYLGKKAFELYLGKNIEKYKYDLSMEVEAVKSKMNSEIESYKNKLNILAKEQEIKFSKLHQERAELIKNIYIKIVLYEKKLMKYVEEMNKGEFLDGQDAVRTELLRELDDIANLYNLHRIYLSSETCGLLDSFMLKCVGISDKLKLINNRNIGKYPDIISEVSFFIKNFIKPIERDLVEEFRSLLGVKNIL